MCKINRILSVVEYMFPDTAVSIGTKHKHSSIITVLLNGRSEFNPAIHRRDMVDCMLHFNLYVKLLDNGLYESGSHEESNNTTRTEVNPGMAITEMAFTLL